MTAFEKLQISGCASAVHLPGRFLANPATSVENWEENKSRELSPTFRVEEELGKEAGREYSPQIKRYGEGVAR